MSRRETADPSRPPQFGGPTKDRHGRTVRTIHVGAVVVGKLLRLEGPPAGWRVQWFFDAAPPSLFPSTAMLGGTLVGSTNDVEDMLACDRDLAATRARAAALLGEEPS